MSSMSSNTDPSNVSNLKVTARSLTLNGQYQKALDQYQIALKYAGKDWVICHFVLSCSQIVPNIFNLAGCPQEIYHNMALCLVQLKEYSKVSAL
jgi:hypothetical protein